MNTRLVAVISVILLVLTLALTALIPKLINETANPNGSGEESGTLFTLNCKTVTQNFTVIVLPDTQGYTQDYPWLFDNQTQWIVDNVEELNIVFVTQLGDLVERADNITMWENANRSMSKLDGNVPWAVLPGNHDQLYYSFENYDTYFGYERFSNQSWYGGTYESGANKNSYQLFSGGGDDYLILHIEYKPTDDILSWASNLIEQNPEKRVTVSTHDYIMGPFNSNQRSEVGEKIWQNLIKHHADQVSIVLCGHASTQTRLTDTVNGHVVYQLLADYQNDTNIESGWLRILEFCPAQDKIFVKTYSPYLNAYKTDPENEFTLNYNMTGESITVLSNCAISQLSFNQSLRQISFEISSETGASGYCNVTIPKNLLSSDSWTVTLDDEVCIFTSSENATHTSIRFTYVYQNPFCVTINGT